MWIRVETNVLGHPKLKKLRRLLGDEADVVCIGLLVKLWIFAANYAPDGVLTKYEDYIDDVLEWDGIKDVLVESGWLVYEDGELIVKDWDEHSGKYFKEREKARERMRKKRSAKVPQDYYYDGEESES